ncbi:sensor domain-containing diguanylate cyclase [Pseudoalteromonas phenolica]|uniref:diguanylate cyclase n=1 Tax=Pseudoalteromonas phenolica TaxID=161398 RepID=A0A4Q7IL33_9GAMM|nr:diguanylate cyclase [Pseudoalteromonas phenolica]RZQ51976.1 sensor domain-containing diguanylate cyclase [Pseudoalteromonas phenolica]
MRFVLFLLVLLSSKLSLAFSVSSEFTYQKQLPFSYTLDDSKSLNDLLRKEVDWRAEPDSTLNLGQADKPLWIKLTLNNLSFSDTDLLLSIDNILLDKVTAYITTQDTPIVTLALGDSLPLVKRPIKHEAQLVPIKLLATQSADIYLQIEHHGAVNAPLSLWHPIEYIKYKSKFNLIYGIFAGFIIALALIHLVLFSFTKKTYFLYAIGFISIIWLLNVHLYGFSYRYLYGNWHWLQQYAQPLLVLLSSVVLLPLIKPFVQINRVRSAFSVPPSYFYTGLITLLLTLSVLPIHLSVAASYILSFVLLTSLLFLFAYQWLKNKSRTPSLVAIFSFMLLALGHQISFELSLISGPQLNTPISYFCYFTMSLILSFTLVKQFIRERDQEVEAQQAKLAQSQAQDALLNEKLKLQEQTQADLEALVDERTFELQVTLRELEDKNRELEQMNIEDPLTKIKNRRYFDKRLQMEVRRSRREQSTLSLVMLDIDHFKNINDTYGHLSGDKAICAVADIINSHLQRPSDEVFRYGGEEFVMLLPNTELAGAQLIAEQIRSTVEAFQLKLDKAIINLTLSAGVYSSVAIDPKSPHIYTDLADKALYEAKQLGRNQVRIYQP